MMHNPALLSAALYLAYAIASSAVRALPAPTSASSPFYVWFYGFSHSLGANWDRVEVALRILLKLPTK